MRSRGVLRFALIRGADAVLICFLLTVVVFILLHLVPGDPAKISAGIGATPREVAAVRHQLGLDRPLFTQYTTYLWDALHGNFGESIALHEPVINVIGQFLPTTLLLAVLALSLALVLGVFLGVLGAFRRGGILDTITSSIAVVGVSLPVFWLGLLLIYYFGVKLKWLPTEGVANWKGYVLPVVALATYPLALITRLTRSSTIEVLGEDYIRTARAKGLPERRVLFVHALRNALIPTVTAAGLSLGFLIGGTFVVETVFNINGLGSWVVSSVLARDIPAVQGATLVIGVGFVVANLIVDVCYGLLNPRIRY
jgi:ABC-type dipeptide/oligopeptide/nickel transport system permease component